MVVILDIEVLEKGPMVGEKIGNPATIGSDGKVYYRQGKAELILMSSTARCLRPTITRTPTPTPEEVPPPPPRGQVRTPAARDHLPRHQHQAR